jgi:predicted RNA-binding Zn-ribbon protein involved in translation (DUF1610 family)
MGRTYLFECPKCGYRAKVSGSPARGIHFAVRTVLCLECKELYDAVTALKTTAPRAAGAGGGMLNSARLGFSHAAKIPASPPTFQTALNRLPPGGAERLKWLHFKAACPVSARHRIREWNQPDKCPKCGLFLEQNAIPFRIWD